MGIPGMILWQIATSAIPSAPTDMMPIIALGAVLLLGLLFVTMGVVCLHSGGTLRISHRWARHAPPDALFACFGSLVDVLGIERKDACLAILHISPAGFLLNPRGHRVLDQYFQLVSSNPGELDAIEAAVAAFNRRQFTPAEIQAARRKRIAGYALLAAGLFAGLLMLYGAAPGRWSHYAQTQNRPLVLIVAATMLALLLAGCAFLHTAANVRPIAPKRPSEDLLTRLASWLAEKQVKRLRLRKRHSPPHTGSDHINQRKQRSRRHRRP